MHTLNPLVLEYQQRLDRHVSVARDAPKLLITCTHEAGHWAAYAHFGVYVCTAYVDLRPGYMDRGCVTPTDLYNLITPQHVPKVDYSSTLAGPRAEFLLTGTVDTGEASAGDRRDAKAILNQLWGDDPYLQGWQEAYWGTQVEAIIRANWRIVEALAYELMRTGRFGWDKPSPSDIEARYGLGYGARNLSAAQQASARRRLAAFHATPEELVQAIAAICA